MTIADVDLALPFAEDLEDVLAAWRVRMIAGGLSDRTIDSRTALIRRLARDVDPIDATKDDLINWMAGLADSAGRSARATYRTYLRMWFDFLVESGRRVDDPSLRLPRVKVPPGVPHPLTPEEVERVLAACAHPRAGGCRGHPRRHARRGRQGWRQVNSARGARDPTARRRYARVWLVVPVRLRVGACATAARCPSRSNAPSDGPGSSVSPTRSGTSTAPRSCAPPATTSG